MLWWIAAPDTISAHDVSVKILRRFRAEHTPQDFQKNRAVCRLAFGFSGPPCFHSSAGYIADPLLIHWWTRYPNGWYNHWNHCIFKPLTQTCSSTKHAPAISATVGWWFASLRLPRFRCPVRCVQRWCGVAAGTGAGAVVPRDWHPEMMKNRHKEYHLVI